MGESNSPEPPGGLGDRPYVFEAEAGVKYAYCRCRQSSQFPLCDGSHRQIGDGQEITPIKVRPESATRLAWCACGRTDRQPDCDGSHARCKGPDEDRLAE